MTTLQNVFLADRPRLMLMGEGQHGKDTVAELLEARGFTWMSSSWAAAKEVVFDVLAPKYGYKTVEECHRDRGNHRQEWYELIKAFNTPDRTRLARKIFDQVDVYVGIRDDEEFFAVREAGMFDYALWVDASKRKPPEGRASCKVTRADANLVIDNNGPEKDLPAMVDKALNQIAFARQSGEILRAPSKAVNMAM